MATNAQKTLMVNRSLAILNAGRTDAAGLTIDAIDDTEFADYTTVSKKNKPLIRFVCMIYAPVLKEVLCDIRPEFAKEYADLGTPQMVDKEIGGWDYTFELPDDFLSLTRQTYEGDLSQGYDCEILHLRGYSHVVQGDDELPYYCTTSHTSADDTDDGQPADDDGNSNWTAMSDTTWPAAAWAESTAYKYNSTGRILASNELTNSAGTSAYIEYIAYALAGQSDEPAYYDANFAKCFCTRLAAEMAIDSKDYERRRQLITEYERMKLDIWRDDAQPQRRTKHVTIFEKRTRGI